MVEKKCCPLCHQVGENVPNIAVRHLVLEDLIKKVIDKENYYVCINENCNVVYYSSNNKNTFYEKHVKVPVWFKKRANPKYICYCNDVTEEQIIDAVLNNDAKNMKDIIRLTGAMKNGQCELNNPLGKCCSPVILETLKKALDSK
ncbi:Csac_0668 family 2Fe-2S cluster-binding (seleno)protein [Tissierella creatinophila]|uniref:BFD-like [2Fe-2S] binding domain protein n=1 Tax=Tissierella creatinophila DSM 6911 TaxID=1123403 RepID=A0A1U7M803_TISCR|nr:(2Fe-2S)-binding protein [Tissierella creatinophila]OLS03464.1 BFD-like [2Fe-2S] binding domain protein [Tissierella creatinophila DSM 6911]